MSFDVAGMEGDESVLVEGVEDLAGVLAGAHRQGEVGVVGVGEAVQGLQGEVRVLGCGAGGVVEDAAASDGGELVPVAEERDAGAGLIGDAEQRAGGVLVEHAGLVDEQQVAGVQPRPDIGSGLGPVVVVALGWAVGAGPGAVVVPAPAVLMGQPGGGVGVGAGLLGGDVGGLEGGGDHDQPLVAHLEHRGRGGQGGGLPGAGGALDHDQGAGAGQRGDHQSLGVVELASRDHRSRPARGGPAGGRGR